MERDCNEVSEFCILRLGGEARRSFQTVRRVVDANLHETVSFGYLQFKKTGCVGRVVGMLS